MEDRKTNLPDRRPPSVGKEWDPKDGIPVAVGIAFLLWLLSLIF